MEVHRRLYKYIKYTITHISYIVACIYGSAFGMLFLYSHKFAFSSFYPKRGHIFFTLKNNTFYKFALPPYYHILVLNNIFQITLIETQNKSDAVLCTPD